jgi:putative transposase
MNDRERVRRHSHRPAHWTSLPGAYIITAGTLHRGHLFDSAVKLDLLRDSLRELTRQYRFEAEAWCVFSNHYHLVGMASDPASIPRMVSHLHANTARAVNLIDGHSGRKVWYQYWDTRIESDSSYLARLRYVYENPVRHGLVRRARDYPWGCAYEVGTSLSEKWRAAHECATEDVVVKDDFQPVMPETGTKVR